MLRQFLAKRSAKPGVGAGTSSSSSFSSLSSSSSASSASPASHGKRKLPQLLEKQPQKKSKSVAQRQTVTQSESESEHDDDEIQEQEEERESVSDDLVEISELIKKSKKAEKNISPARQSTRTTTPKTKAKISESAEKLLANDEAEEVEIQSGSRHRDSFTLDVSPVAAKYYAYKDYLEDSEIDSKSKKNPTIFTKDIDGKKLSITDFQIKVANKGATTYINDAADGEKKISELYAHDLRRLDSMNETERNSEHGKRFLMHIRATNLMVAIATNKDNESYEDSDIFTTLIKRNNLNEMINILEKYYKKHGQSVSDDAEEKSEDDVENTFGLLNLHKYAKNTLITTVHGLKDFEGIQEPRTVFKFLEVLPTAALHMLNIGPIALPDALHEGGNGDVPEGLAQLDSLVARLLCMQVTMAQEFHALDSEVNLSKIVSNKFREAMELIGVLLGLLITISPSVRILKDRREGSIQSKKMARAFQHVQRIVNGGIENVLEPVHHEIKLVRIVNQVLSVRERLEKKPTGKPPTQPLTRTAEKDVEANVFEENDKPAEDISGSD